MKHSIRKKTVPCQGLDLVAASHRGRVSPFMYCHMELTGRLDMDRFKGAISMSVSYTHLMNVAVFIVK